MRENTIALTATRAEITALVAGARLALDLLRVDTHAPAGAADLLAKVVADYDAAVTRGLVGSEAPTCTEPREGC